MAVNEPIAISQLAAHEVSARSDELVALLRDAVDGGASVGFLPPLPEHEAHAYWEGVAHAVQSGHTQLLIATEAGRLVGSVQLLEATRSNGSHRAEVAKLMVRTAKRRHGIGRALMAAIETLAAQRGRSTLVLDTRRGDASQMLYQALGWTKVGEIPAYARSADGSLHTTVFYYRLLA
jgi:acetyltransferase